MLGGLPTALAILILGFTAAARAQGTDQSQPLANQINPQTQPTQPTSSRPKTATFFSQMPPFQPAAPILAQPAMPVLVPPVADPSIMSAQQQTVLADNNPVAKSKSEKCTSRIKPRGTGPLSSSVRW